MFGLILPHRPVLTPPTQITETQLAFPDIPCDPPFSHLVVFLLPGTALPAGAGVAVYVKLPHASGTNEPNAGFTLMGAIGPGRESAIFRVNLGASLSRTTAIGAGGAAAGTIDEDAMVDEGSISTSTSTSGAPNAAAAAAAPTTATGTGPDGQQPVAGGAGTLTVGLSIELAANIEAQVASLTTANPTTSGFNPGASSGALVRQRTTTNTAGAASAVTTKVLAQRIIGNAFNFLASFAGDVGAGGEEVVPLKAFRDWWVKFEKRVELDPGFLEREESG